MTMSNNTDKNVLIRIRRQDGPSSPPRWEEFAIPLRPHMNVISCLQYIAGHPITTSGQPTTPPVWSCSCLEEICGACTMIVNGRVRQACSALIEKLVGPGQPVVLEPMTKFPVVRDLFVDRQRLFKALSKAKCWIPLDGTYHLGPGPIIPEKIQEECYPLSRCITCGCCLEACPQYTQGSKYVGAAVISQVRLFNGHPIGAALAPQRLEVMMDEGGVGECGKAGNCVRACPKQIPLLESIAAIQRQATVYSITRFFTR